MNINLNENSEMPIYMNIAYSISRDIKSGVLPPGYRLPTLRGLSESLGVSRGTAKHAYDQLEQWGQIEMTQGRGTFVGKARDGNATADRLMSEQVVGRMISELETLSMTVDEIRELVLRLLHERDEYNKNVRIGVVDCNPEALSTISGQIASFPNTIVSRYLLSDVLSGAKTLDHGLDLVITTTTHYGELGPFVPPPARFIKIVVTASTNTILEFSRLPRDEKAGLLCASEKFSSIILRFIESAMPSIPPPGVYIFGRSSGIRKFLAPLRTLILPPDYARFCESAEADSISRALTNGARHVCFDYQLDRGSLAYIAGQSEEILAVRNS